MCAGILIITENIKKNQRKNLILLQRKYLVKNIITIGSISSINILLAFFYHWILVIKLGPGISTDALFASMAIPQLILSIISTSLIRVLVPLLSGEDKDTMRQDAWSIMTLIVILFSSITFLLYFSSSFWVSLIVPGFDKDGISLTARLTEIQLLSLIFIAVSSVQLSLHYAKQQFVWAELSGIIANGLSLLIMLILLPTYGVLGAAMASVARHFFQTLLLIRVLGKPTLPKIKNDRTGLVWMRLKPLLAGNLYYKTEPVIDRALLSSTTSGTLSLYYLAQQIYSSGCQVLNKAIATPLNTKLSREFKSSNFTKFDQHYKNAITLNLLITLVTFALIFLAGKYALELLIEYDKFQEDDVENLWWILVCLGGTFISGALGQISSTALYSCGDTKTPTKIGVITYSFYIPLKIIIFFQYGMEGLAISTSIFVTINFLLQHRAVSQKIKTSFMEPQT